MEFNLRSWFGITKPETQDSAQQELPAEIEKWHSALDAAIQTANNPASDQADVAHLAFLACNAGIHARAVLTESQLEAERARVCKALEKVWEECRKSLINTLGTLDEAKMKKAEELRRRMRVTHRIGKHFGIEANFPGADKYVKAA